MGFKSVLGKIGKIALTAAPYMAAPITGGASLMATGLANKAVQKWSEHDAKANIAKGLAPSKFDSVLGKIGNVASTASMFIPGGQLGALGKAGSAATKIGKVANIANKVNQGMGVASQVMGAIRNQQQPQQQQPQFQQQQQQQYPIGPSYYPQQQQQQPAYRGQTPNYSNGRGYMMNMRRPQPSYAYGR